MDKLKEFHRDKAMMTAVAEFTLDYLAKEIVREAFNGKDTSEYKKVRDIIQGMFRELDGKYKPKKIEKEKQFSESE